jgi:type IV pilus assembly protein PilM
VPRLDTYGIVNTAFQLGGKNDQVAVEHLSTVLKALMEKAGVSTKKCSISFPNSSVFSSVISVPKMKSEELASALEFEAKKYVPLPLNEIDLSWSVVSEDKEEGGSQKILLTAVPKQVISRYMEVLSLAGLEAEVGEIEVLALMRSLIGSKPINCVIIDIGAKNTGLNIIENGLLRLSRNINVGGESITKKIAESLNISFLRAEQFKKDFGVNGPSLIPETVKPILNIIKSEVRQVLTIYDSQNNHLDKLVLVGGGANMPGLQEYFSDMKIEVEMGNPLKSVAYSKDLESVLNRSRLSLSVAIGLALRKD